MNSGKVRSGRMAGKWVLLLVLMVGLGCAPKNQIVESSYRLPVPTLQAPPMDHPCQVDDLGAQICSCVIKSDYQKIVRRMKAQCLALGGSPAECQTEEP